ncbi:MAG: hypothetical protein KFH87_09990 [Bacteroidetes bacterium]|nr:hypothetical protein [Bacteroidota bacterium]
MKATTLALIRLWVVLCVCLSCACTMHAQELTEDAGIIELETTSGSVYYGFIRGQSDEALEFETREGIRMQIPLAQVQSMRPAGNNEASTDTTDEDVMAGEKEKEEPQLPRRERPANGLLVLPTSYAPRAGEVQIGLYELSYIAGKVGIADMAEVFAGSYVAFWNEGQLAHLGVKITPWETEEAAVAFGGMVGQLFFWNPSTPSYHTLLFAMGTINTGHGWVTASYTTLAGEPASSGWLTLALDIPVSDNVRFLGEHWIPTYGASSSILLGTRFQTGILQIDLGMCGSLDKGDLFDNVFPWLGIAMVL